MVMEALVARVIEIGSRRAQPVNLPTSFPHDKLDLRRQKP